MLDGRAHKSEEFRDLPDTGCELAASCLACPEPLCKHDVADEVARQVERIYRDGAIRILVADLPPRVVARRLHVSRDTVRRATRSGYCAA